MFSDALDLHNCQIALGDFLVFLMRVASSPKIQAKMTSIKWTQLLLKLVGYDEETGINNSNFAL